MNKTCYTCRQEKLIDEFYFHPKTFDKHLGKCKLCCIDFSIKNRNKNKKYYDVYDKNRYRNNIHRIFCAKYDGMRQRVMGLAHHSKTKGKALINENEFLHWCYEQKNYKKFINLYNIWKVKQFQRKFAPSIDRINNNIGYIVNNLQWLSQSENSIKSDK